MSVLNENTIIGASAAGEYEIEQSLRFNDDDSAYLSRTPSITGNRKTWTWSGWVKRGNLGSTQFISHCYDGSSSQRAEIKFEAGDTLRVYVGGNSGAGNVYTTAVFRDSSAWYHVTVAMDTTQATAADRIKLYVNGVLQAITINQQVSQNFDGLLNTTNAHQIASQAGAVAFDGYLSEVNFIDGQALTADSFGETGDYGEWKPIAYAGTYGTNGFYLKFENASSLGNDSAGSNNWTPTNLAATDQMLDSPTNNFATLSPLVVGANGFGAAAYGMSEGNLKGGNFGTGGWSVVGSSWSMVNGSGLWYFELGSLSSAGSGQCAVGIHKADTALAIGLLGYTGDSDGYSYNSDGKKFNNDTGTAYGATWGNLDVIGMAIDMSGSTSTITFYKNNVSQGVAFSGITGDLIAALSSTITGVSVTNFGQDSSFAGNKTPQGNQDANGIGDFYYAPPAGFLALCTANLPDVDVIPSEHFNTVLYTGNGSTQSITGVGFQPDFTWVKSRDTAWSHSLQDILRPTVSGSSLPRLLSNSTAAESINSAMVSFDSDGFSLNADANFTNANSDTFVAWNWKAGGSASSNTNGTITSSVSANPSAGFSIVSYTGTGANATVGHSLSQKTELMLFKNRTTAREWQVFAESEGAGEYGVLDSTAAFAASAIWQNTLPTSSVFSIGNFSGVNTNAENYIAYCFHSVDGYSKVGSYTGNGSADGTFVHCGFRPAYVMVKRTNSTGNWVIYDNKRSGFNVDNDQLQANLSDTEYDGATYAFIDLLASGFKLRSSGADRNASGGTYIFLAFAESPFKHSNAR